ncbi:hypothetical protein MNBD_ALPHA06-1658 [hydrothermal vent metagenome]|uniref:Uncharacterized protein n=1 Tax=hydrothermal vent metagenome TaxID=652676 RepID=A0A3B0S3L1_9ZZZZ
MQNHTQLANLAIQHLQSQIAEMGFTPIVQFELEGCCLPAKPRELDTSHFLDFTAINQALSSLGVQGVCKAEYWEYQWEWASKMAGQSPLKTAQDLAIVKQNLPDILLQNGAKEVHIHPVFWQQKQANRPLLPAHQNDVFPGKPVHIPNAIQLSISALNVDGSNALLDNQLGAVLQNILLVRSYECCWLFAPIEAAYQRFQLKSNYDLDKELTSPSDISGGHQGSIGFFQRRDKHDQLVGGNWRKQARIEHRLGAACAAYHPQVNCAFALACLLEAIQMCKAGAPVLEPYRAELPVSLKAAKTEFAKSHWFQRALGKELKTAVLQNVDAKAD